MQFFKYTVPAEGYLTVQACSDVFDASVTVYGDGTDADGAPVSNSSLGCGGVFNGCSDPNLLDPDNQLV